MATARLSLLVRMVVVTAALLGTERAAAAQQRMVRVGVSDDTQRWRIPEAAELWLSGTGSLRLHQKCNRLRNGSLSCGPLDLGMRGVGQLLELIVFPNGRTFDIAGRELGGLRVLFKLTLDMCAQGCARDMISVNISDTEVEIYGAPVMAAGAKNGITVPRQQ